jgi:hypothetical protein
MTNTTSRYGLALGIALLGSTALLAGCGSSPPMTETSTTERSSTMVQPQPMSSSTTTTTQQVQRP